MKFLKKYIQDLKVNFYLMNDKVLSMLGIAKKAGKIMSGTNLLTTFIRSDNKPQLVLLANNASDNTKKLLNSTSMRNQVHCIEVDYSMETLSHAIGASYGVACVAVFDKGFANSIINKLEEKNAENASQEV